MNSLNVAILLTILLQGIDDPNQFNDFLILGYVAMWVIGVIYIISLVMRQRNVRQDIQLMQQILQEDEEMTNQ